MRRWQDKLDQDERERNVFRWTIGMFVLFILLMVLAHTCTGCIALPESVESATHTLHKGNIIICEDYVDVLLEHCADDDKLQDKLLKVKYHLKLSEELDRYVTNKGGHYVPLWHSGKEEDE